jgi:hypothetical protein
MYVMYYVTMLWCWQIVWILIRTNHPYLRVGCHIHIFRSYTSCVSDTLKL